MLSFVAYNKRNEKLIALNFTSGVKYYTIYFSTSIQCAFVDLKKKSHFNSKNGFIWEQQRSAIQDK